VFIVCPLLVVYQARQNTQPVQMLCGYL